MAKRSAGLLLFRWAADGLMVFLVHPGGPFWAKKDEGAWSIPKGEFMEGEDPLAAARREFEEETGMTVAGGSVAGGSVAGRSVAADPIPLEPVRQPGGKLVYAWAVEGDVDPAMLRSNTFTMEWPPKSGRQREFPEIDGAVWLPVEEAKRKILKGQAPLLDQLVQKLSRP